MFYFGAAYYPELWDKSEIDKDIVEMKKLGFNCMRIGEFAWSTMEKNEGVFDFSLFKYTVDKLYENGIYTIMCTPSCTPPRWFFNKYPDACRVISNNFTLERIPVHARVHICKSNENAREKNRIIAEKMAEAFASHPGVIGWQIDNEIFPYEDGCFCDNCVRLFREYLKSKYKTIDNLNKDWGMYRWSLDYNDFDEIIPPRTRNWENPSRQVEWIRFQCSLINSYVHEQADAIRKHSSAPIGTDMMTNNFLSYEKINEKLDVVQYNHYEREKLMYRTMFAFDFMRSQKNRPFWVTETQAGWNGSIAAYNDYHHIDNCYINTISPIAKGGEMNLFWLWRAHSNGHELGHGAILSTSGRPINVALGAKKAINDIEKSKELLEGSKVKSKIALTYSSTAVKLFKYAPIIRDFDHNYREILIDNFHAPFRHHNIDVIETNKELGGYKVLLSPFLANATENGFKERVIKWINDGGTWIVGPLSDIMTENASKYKSAPFSFLEELCGVYTKYQIPFNAQIVNASLTENGKEIGISMCYDAFEAVDCEAVATYSGGEDYDGLIAIARRRVGKGQVILLGTMPDKNTLLKLVDIAPIAEASENIQLVERSGDVNGIIAFELESKSGYIVLDKEYYDMVNERVVSGRIEMKPYSALFLKEI